MHDPETFEPRFAAAVGRYLEDAPMEVDAVALAHATAVASRRAGTRRFPIVNIALRFVLVGAIAGAALLGVSLTGGNQKLLPPQPCSTAPSSIPTPGVPLAPRSPASGATTRPTSLVGDRSDRRSAAVRRAPAASRKAGSSPSTPAVASGSPTPGSRNTPSSTRTARSSSTGAVPARGTDGSIGPSD